MHSDRSFILSLKRQSLPQSGIQLDTVGEARAYKNAYSCLSRHGYIYTRVEKLPALIQLNSIRATTLGRGKSNNIKITLPCFPNQFCSFPLSKMTFQLPMQKSRCLRPTQVQIRCAAPIYLPKRVAIALMSFQLQSACGKKCSLLLNGSLCLKPKRGSFYPARRLMQYEYCHLNYSFCCIC